jgi:surfactin synthase thioesterase subunit
LGGNIIKLFAFSYAFGSSYCYNDLKKYLDKNIEFIQFDYPGHGSRILESLLYNVSDIVDDTYKHIKSKIKPNEKYALLGYSMGGLICYELLKRLENEHNPNCVFIFASHHPDYRYKSDNYEQYDLKDVKSLLKEYGGTPADALDSECAADAVKGIAAHTVVKIITTNKAVDNILLKFIFYLLLLGSARDFSNNRNDERYHLDYES